MACALYLLEQDPLASFPQLISTVEIGEQVSEFIHWIGIRVSLLYSPFKPLPPGSRDSDARPQRLIKVHVDEDTVLGLVVPPRIQ